MGFFDEDDEAEYFKADNVSGLRPGGLLRRSPHSPTESRNRKWSFHGRNGWQFLHESGQDFERALVALLDRMYEDGDLTEIKIELVDS